MVFTFASWSCSRLIWITKINCVVKLLSHLEPCSSCPWALECPATVHSFTLLRRAQVVQKFWYFFLASLSRLYTLLCMSMILYARQHTHLFQNSMLCANIWITCNPHIHNDSTSAIHFQCSQTESELSKAKSGHILFKCVYPIDNTFLQTY